MTVKTDLNLSFGREREYFPPEIVIHPDDPADPPVYLPHIVIAEDERLPQAVADAAWAQWEEDDPLGNAESEASPNDTDRAKYKSLSDDAGESTKRSTPELTLARYGRQVLRVYAPTEYEAVERCAWFGIDDDSVDIDWCLKTNDMRSSERLVVRPALSQSLSETVEQYGRKPTSDKDTSGYEGRDAVFEEVPVEGEKDGYFNQLKAPDDAQACVLFKARVWDQELIYVVPGNRAEFSAGKQVIKNGRRSHLFREEIQFSGDKSKRLKYWYMTDSVVTVVAWTQFIDVEGRVIKRRPNNYATDKDGVSGYGSYEYKPHPGVILQAECECWGTMVVEYLVEYTEYEFLYDLPSCQLAYEVKEGKIEKVGRINETLNGDVIGTTNPGVYVAYDRRDADRDWVKEHKDDGDFDINEAPQVGYKLVCKIGSYSIPSVPFEIFYTNGRRIVTAQFNAKPKIADAVHSELPRVVLFHREKKEISVNPSSAYSFVVRDKLVQRVTMDISGKISKEVFE